jgi:hypothetical protein
MTSDGISSDDWERIQEIAAVIANAAIADDNVLYDSATLEMANALKELKDKYGALPSIIATEAEYAANPVVKVNLLQEALNLARRGGDEKNERLIIHSLAEVYVDELKDKERALYWIDRFAQIAIDVESQKDLAGLRSKVNQKK